MDCAFSFTVPIADSNPPPLAYRFFCKTGYKAAEAEVEAAT